MGFDVVFDYTVPYLHPLAVHFPVVLFLLAGGCAALYLFQGRAIWRKSLLLFLVLGTVTAYWAEETGEELEDSVEGTPIVEELVDFHEDMARITVYAGAIGVVTLGLFTVWWARRPEVLGSTEPLAFRLLAFLLAAGAAAAVAYTGHIGAVMVWGVTA